MAINNYGASHMPEIKKFAGGKERSSVTYVGLDSATIYQGSFVPFATGSIDTPSGIEFGVPAYADDTWIGGFVMGFVSSDGVTPLIDNPNKAGTVTAATGEIPYAYTFDASNDESNTTSMIGEMVEIMPVCSADIIELSLWGAGTVSVDRGTTTAWGTTTSSANFGVSMALDTTYSFALLESSAAKTIANLDFTTTHIRGKTPELAHRVYAYCMRSFDRLDAPN